MLQDEITESTDTVSNRISRALSFASMIEEIANGDNAEYRTDYIATLADACTKELESVLTVFTQ